MCEHQRSQRLDAGFELDTVCRDSELHTEVCRGGRVHRIVVNRRTRAATTLTAAEADMFEAVVAGERGETAAALLAELRARDYFVDLHGGSGVRWARARAALRSMDFRFPRGHGLVTAIYRRGGHLLFRPCAVLVQALIALIGLAAVVDTFADASLHLRLSEAQIPGALTASLFAVAIHECAHALVVVHHGRRVDAIGLRLHLGTPAFYVESVEALLLTRRQRLVQAIAGSWAEWMVTSVVAVWVTLAPTPIGLAVLARFVMLNTFTIASNLLPFVGLDGHLLLADLIGEPDLGASSRGAVGELAAALLSRRPICRRQWLLAGYAALNALVACGLLLAAGLFWYSMFGSLIAGLLADGALGWITLAVAATLILRPAVAAAQTHVADALATAAELANRVRFRAQWHWRLTATHALAATLPELSTASDRALSVIAGQLRRVRTSSVDTDPPRGALHCHLHHRRAGLFGTRTGTGIVHPPTTACPARRRDILVVLDQEALALQPVC